jgi:hypothetical protein
MSRIHKVLQAFKPVGTSAKFAGNMQVLGDFTLNGTMREFTLGVKLNECVSTKTAMLGSLIRK